MNASKIEVNAAKILNHIDSENFNGSALSCQGYGVNYNRGEEAEEVQVEG